MKKLLFSTYDSKINSYQPPFTAEHAGEAIRAFERASNDPESNIYHYPSDFTLFEIGIFDTETGKIENHKVSKDLGKAIHFKKEVK